MDILNTLKDAVSGAKGTEKPVELKETDAKLTALKSQIEVKNGVELNSFLDEKMKPSFLKDLADLGISDPAKQTELWELLVKEVKERLLLGTPDHMELAAFIERENNLPKLKEYASSGNAVANLKKKIEEIPGIGWILAGGLGATFASWAKDSKNSFLKPLWKKLADAFGEKEETPQEKTVSKEKEMVDSVKKGYAENSIELDENEIRQGLRDLGELGFKDEGDKKLLTTLLQDSFKEGSNFKKIRDAIRVYEPTTGSVGKFKFKTSDLILQSFAPKNIELLVQAINPEKDKKAEFFKLAETNVASIRTLLDAAKEAKNDNMVSVLGQKFPMEGQPTTAPAATKTSDAKKDKTAEPQADAKAVAKDSKKAAGTAG
jgi:hypothetical protein